jgi:hypothetical protein
MPFKPQDPASIIESDKFTNASTTRLKATGGDLSVAVNIVLVESVHAPTMRLRARRESSQTPP